MHVMALIPIVAYMSPLCHVYHHLSYSYVTSSQQRAFSEQVKLDGMKVALFISRMMTTGAHWKMVLGAPRGQNKKEGTIDHGKADGQELQAVYRREVG